MTSRRKPAETPLRRLRRSRGLRAVHLAAAADISVQALHQIESGKGGPKLATARRLAAALGVSVDELFPIMVGPARRAA